MTDNLASALAAVQAKLPHVTKGKTADTGKYRYTYADLSDIAQAIHPLLGANGLAWITKPTLNADGAFVLAYKLKHVSGEEECGEYPLPDPTKTPPQTVGSAVTYGRRYCLCAVTGVVADEDDDGQAAQSTTAAKGTRSKRAERGPLPAAEDPWTAPEGEVPPTPPSNKATDEEWFTAWQATVDGCTDLPTLKALWDEALEKHRFEKLTDSDLADAVVLKDLQKAAIERANSPEWPAVAGVPGEAS